MLVFGEIGLLPNIALTMILELRASMPVRAAQDFRRLGFR